MRCEPPHPNTMTSSGLQVIDDPDLELVGILAGRDLRDFMEEPGAREADEHELVVERPDPRRHRLVM